MRGRRLVGMRAVITGASSGIGRELARELGRHGARLLLTARREERLDELSAELSEQHVEVRTLAGDLTDADFRRRLVAAAADWFGALDLLVNNAGSGAVGVFRDAAPERLRDVMEVNFFAPAELIRAALPLLAAGQRPLIANIGSVLGHRAMPGKSEYCASKFALHGLSDAIRAELAPLGIDVLLVHPSTTQSEFFERVVGDRDAVPKNRWTMSPTVVARRTVAAIRQGKHEIVLSLGGRLLVWTDRLWPWLADQLVARFGMRS